MNRTPIEWVKNPDGTQGYTWNPITGCLNHVNGLCKGGGFPCYAYRLANGRLRQKYLANTNIARSGYPIPKRLDELPMDEDDPFYPRFWPERIARYFDGHKKPRGVFVCDMGELFGDWIPKQWQEMIFTTIKAFPQDRFYLLTKQPQNLIKWNPFPDNCWVGGTATSTKMMVEALNQIYDVKAKVIFLSLEPLLEWHVESWIMANNLKSQQINWLIIGAQTKPYKPPKIEWVREIVEAADKAGVPVFLKDNLKPMLPEELPFYDVIDEDPMMTPRLRQEMPK